MSRLRRAIAELGAAPKETIETSRGVGYRLGCDVTRILDGPDSTPTTGATVAMLSRRKMWGPALVLASAVLCLGTIGFGAAGEVHGRLANHSEWVERATSATTVEAREKALAYATYWAVAHEGRGRWDEDDRFQHLNRSLVDPHPQSRGKPNLLQWPLAALDSDALSAIVALASSIVGALLAEFLLSRSVGWTGAALGLCAGVAVCLAGHAWLLVTGSSWEHGVDRRVPLFSVFSAVVLGVGVVVASRRFFRARAAP